MGGDHAPEEVVAGALLAAGESNAEIVLVGDEPRVRALLTGPSAGRVSVAHAPDAVPMAQSASAALRTADRTSLGIAVNLVKCGEADAVVSAGNSGAFLAISLIKLRTLEGISRPAIATVWPALEGPTVLLDSGANVDCRPEWLEQFGIMGAAYSKAVLKVANPRVAVLSVGEERTKGNQLVLEAAKLARSRTGQLHRQRRGARSVSQYRRRDRGRRFRRQRRIENRRGDDRRPRNGHARNALGGNLLTKLGAAMLAPALRGLRRKFDYETYGGAPLLGLRGNCIFTHGRASRNAIKHAILAAVQEANNDVIGRITEMMAPAPAAEEA